MEEIKDRLDLKEMKSAQKQTQELQSLISDNSISLHLKGIKFLRLISLICDVPTFLGSFAAKSLIVYTSYVIQELTPQ